MPSRTQRTNPGRRRNENDAITRYRTFSITQHGATQRDATFYNTGTKLKFTVTAASKICGNNASGWLNASRVDMRSQ